MEKDEVKVCFLFHFNCNFLFSFLLLFRESSQKNTEFSDNNHIITSLQKHGHVSQKKY